MLDDAALQYRTTVVEVLPEGAKAEFIQPAKVGQIRVRKSSLGQVEVFLMGRVGTSILGRPRPLSAQRRARSAHLNFTLNCEEPHKSVTVFFLTRKHISASETAR
ncbi:hypothetical protein [Cryobacterium sp. PH29-G1]|uniref:hypothetical protein n=1 Tax=Cryobacterium sp. PH29-G1 TaxID=3046211 RepID=UPI0024B9933F|nr:hypothetical protein [Cryobacterium sp. PH29-G1]